MIAWLYENADVLDRSSDEETGALRLTLRIATEKRGRLEAQLAKAGLRVSVE